MRDLKSDIRVDTPPPSETLDLDLSFVLKTRMRCLACADEVESFAVTHVRGSYPRRYLVEVSCHGQQTTYTCVKASQSPKGVH